MIDQATIQVVAAQTNIPPPILYALTQAPVNGAVADTPTALEQTARSLEGLFSRYGTWESALSAMVTGDPQAYQSPTSSVGGQVSYIMGIAGSRPTYGMTGWAPSDPSKFTAGSRAFGSSIQQTSQYGGAVGPQHAQAWYQAADGARVNAYQATAGRAAEGTPSPFSLEAMPFDAQWLSPSHMSEDYGDRSGPGGFAEMGNDYALPHGAPLRAAISGRIKVVVPSQPNTNTGLTVYIVRPDGSKMYYGHLAGTPGELPVKDGDYVQAGSLIGRVGGDPHQDPYPGNSTGPHVEIGVYDSRGVLHDPRPMLLQQGSQPQTATQMSNVSRETSTQQSQSTSPDPAKVSGFAQRLQAMNIEPEQFIRDFPGLSTVRRRLLGHGTTLDDYSRYAGMDVATALKAVRSEPHPVYPEYTVGQIHDTGMTAQLAAQHYAGRNTSLFEVSRLAAGGASLNDIVRHFSNGAAASPAAAPAGTQASAPGPADATVRRREGVVTS